MNLIDINQVRFLVIRTRQTPVPFLKLKYFFLQILLMHSQLGDDHSIYVTREHDFYKSIEII